VTTTFVTYPCDPLGSSSKNLRPWRLWSPCAQANFALAQMRSVGCYAIVIIAVTVDDLREQIGPRDLG
jgi:hypothetical protein